MQHCRCFYMFTVFSKHVMVSITWPRDRWSVPATESPARSRRNRGNDYSKGNQWRRREGPGMKTSKHHSLVVINNLAFRSKGGSLAHYDVYSLAGLAAVGRFTNERLSHAKAQRAQSRAAAAGEGLSHTKVRSTRSRLAVAGEDVYPQITPMGADGVRIDDVFKGMGVLGGLYKDRIVSDFERDSLFIIRPLIPESEVDKILLMVSLLTLALVVIGILAYLREATTETCAFIDSATDSGNSALVRSYMQRELWRLATSTN